MSGTALVSVHGQDWGKGGKLNTHFLLKKTASSKDVFAYFNLLQFCRRKGYQCCHHFDLMAKRSGITVRHPMYLMQWKYSCRM